jgi:hypothetical protein
MPGKKYKGPLNVAQVQALERAGLLVDSILTRLPGYERCKVDVDGVRDICLQLLEDINDLFLHVVHDAPLEEPAEVGK